MRNWWGLSVLCMLVGCDGELAQNGDDTGVVAETSIADSSTADSSSSLDSSTIDSAVSDTTTIDSAKSDAVSGDAPAGCTGLHGGPMVNIGAYCIDKYEVTNGDYNKFLDAPAGERSDVVGCDWNDGFETAVIDPALAKRPRTMVDWCDAAAYCKWAGKRLCGKPGGGGVAYVLFADPTKSEWMDACTAAGTQTYGYAGAYDATKCQTESGSGGVLDVGSRPDCHSATSPYDAVFDLTGNVEEWVDSCQLSPPQKTSLCHGPGGAAGDGEAKARCASTLTVAAANQKYDGLGFRCCKSP